MPGPAGRETCWEGVVREGGGWGERERTAWRMQCDTILHGLDGEKTQVLVPGPWLASCLTLVKVLISTVKMRKRLMIADRLVMRLKYM